MLAIFDHGSMANLPRESTVLDFEGQNSNSQPESLLASVTGS
jgi:hypothetical protein